MLYDELIEMIDSSVNTLLQLLRSALGNKAECKFHSETDWRKIVDFSFSQGVAALAVDGLQKAYELNPKLSLEIDKPELEDLRYELFGGAMTVEADYSRHKEVITELMAFYRDMGVKPMLIKGCGLSLDYPTPEHRASGDIDVYLYHLGEYADQMVASRLGIGVKQNEDKHSVFEFKGITVENHASFTNIVEYPSYRQMEEFLQEEAQKARAVEMGGAVMYLPTAMFNAVFLPCHIAGHFVYGGMSLKQIVDWAVFVSRHYDEIDWTRVFELAGGAGFLPLLKALNGIVVRSLGVERECVPDDFGPERVMERVMEELFAPAVDRRSESYFAKACRFFGAKWKYNLVFWENYFLTFFRRGWASFRGRHLKNSRNVWAN